MVDYVKAIKDVEAVLSDNNLTREEALTVLATTQFKLIQEGVRHFELLGWKSNEAED